jgi:hypothetical protein
LDVISLIEYKEKKKWEEEVAKGRTPLYVSHLSGKISNDFSKTITDIKIKLGKINNLMIELRKLNNEGQQKFESIKKP